MTVSIRQTLASTMIGGGGQLTWDGVAAYLRREYFDSDFERDRRKRHRKRQELYQDGGIRYIHELIDQVFHDQNVRDMRKKWAKTARFNNVIKRLVNELSTVYQEPAKRTVNGDTNNAAYQRVQTLCRQHERSKQVSKLANLHRSLLAGFRVRNVGTISDPVNQMAIDIITPDCCHLVCHPNDPTHLIAVAIDINTRQASGAGPARVVWTSHEKFFLDSSDRIIGKPVEHGFPRLPFSHLSLEPPSGSLWPGEAGEDLVAAHMAIWFSSVCLLKEAKSATVLPIIAGDATQIAREQATDSELPVEAPDGTSISTVDLSMDLAMFRDTNNHVLETVANNYGMSAALIHHQGVQSAEARDLMRVPLRELRLDQQTPLREFERDFAEVQSMVLERDLPEHAFKLDGWHIDFADPQTPRSVKEQLEEFEHARRLNLDSTIRYIMRQNPDLDEEQAKTVVELMVADELWRNEAIRPMAEISGSPGAEVAGGDVKSFVMGVLNAS